MKVQTKDKIVRSVLKKMDERSLIGQKKYGSTMHDEISTNKKDLFDFLVDTQEELMDALLYIEAAKACYTEEIQEAAVKLLSSPCVAHDFEEDEERMKVIGQNGNEGTHYEETV